MRQLMKGLTLVAALALAIGTVQAQTPRRGGELNQAAQGSPETMDCHATATHATAIHLLPHYSTLLRISNANYPDVEANLAVSWETSSDGLTYTFKLRDDVLFHDGSRLTSADVKATYERLRNPPPGPAPRKALFAEITSIETPDPTTVVFRLSERNSSMMEVFANPWNCVYSAEKLKSDPNYPAQVVMGTGPFRFIDRVRDQVWRAERFDGYFKKGLPYLDKLTTYTMQPAAQINALDGGQIDTTLAGVPPPERDRLMERPDRFAVQSSPMLTLIMVGFNTKIPPYDDVRVRRALALAIDHREVTSSLSKIIAVKEVGGILRPGSKFAASETEKASFPGFGNDIEAARAEARKLLAEAGQAKLTVKLMYLKNNVYEPIAIFVTDQWRKIGVNVQPSTVQAAQFASALNGRQFDVALEFASNPLDEPVTQLVKYLSASKSPVNYQGYEDSQLDQLHRDLKLATADEQERRIIREFEHRVLVDKVYYAPVGWSQRDVVSSTRMQGWKILTSQFLDLDMEKVWVSN